MSRSPDRTTSDAPPGWQHCLACGAGLGDGGGEARSPYCADCTEPEGRPS